MALHCAGRRACEACARRGGRVAEGTRLLSEYGAASSIAGSNPALSAVASEDGRITRGRILVAAAGPLAGAGVAGCGGAGPRRGPRGRPSVVVVGAGLAG